MKPSPATVAKRKRAVKARRVKAADLKRKALRAVRDAWAVRSMTKRMDEAPKP